MDGLWEKISSYNLFNNLFPGALFIYLLERSTSVVLSTEDIVKNIVLYYFVGLVIGRVGSIVVEPILKAVRVIRFTPYSDYISACKKDSKIEMLQEVANMYRTLLTMSILLLAALLCIEALTNNNYNLSKWVSSFFTVVFIASYIKQINYIVARVVKANKLP
ncbi:phosphohistidine phosphatase [Klebsiella quasipneumoniae]|uniref:phosphohistidine phosphatase n=1 Tax=Klebsiella quasipneumoniae TaxID=1463165 RepID=UPI0027F357DF|nr:phosphohistidine phosphatase [Klebsiella quasipneumoniae]EKZ5476150.1 phosphohistidine phosphatase [Klebsiella quasipneumoniae]EKZ5640884.1 phosphohistidine phosphatase [Klebsiella quasipneumoniae]HBQ2792245.1 phosphohistidine phosphatase [Klebsiella pneumoniae]HBR4218919.1 phosphohistidine phosphatase [Klebsiella pneumoniae]